MVVALTDTRSSPTPIAPVSYTHLEPLDGDMTLAGPVDVELEVILSTTDADFVVRLIDVFPDDDPQSRCV